MWKYNTHHSHYTHHTHHIVGFCFINQPNLGMLQKNTKKHGDNYDNYDNWGLFLFVFYPHDFPKPSAVGPCELLRDPIPLALARAIPTSAWQVSLGKNRSGSKLVAQKNI